MRRFINYAQNHRSMLFTEITFEPWNSKKEKKIQNFV